MPRVLMATVGILVLLLVAVVVFVELRNRSGVRKADAEFAAYEPSPLGDFGSTRTLSILPYVFRNCHHELATLHLRARMPRLLHEGPIIPHLSQSQINLA